MRKHWTKIFIGFLVLTNAFQAIDRYVLTHKLAQAYQAQRNFEDASDKVIRMLQDAITELNDKCVLKYNRAVGSTPEDLKTHYDEMNEAYFGGMLPETVSFEVPKDGLYNDKGGRLLGRTLCIQKHCTMQFDKEMNAAPITTELTEDHEICHVYTYGRDLDPHGPAFQSCMLGLAIRGAFKDVW